MGLFFYPRIVGVPADHCIHQFLRDLPARFERQKLTRDWVVEGPLHDEDADEYYFVLSGRSTGTHQLYTISAEDFLFSPSAVDRWISGMVADCMCVEVQTCTMQVLMGASEEAVGTPETQETYIIEDCSRGTGEVTVRRPSCNDACCASPESSGGLILPA